MIDDPFRTVTEAKDLRGDKPNFGVRGKNQRYHMPLLPGEKGVKTGGDWVPGGIQSMTNLAGALEDTRALSVWEQALALVGIALSDELHEELVLMVQQAASAGVVFARMRDYPEFREALAGKPYQEADSIVARAKRAARAGAAAQRGTNRHTAWEHRGATGELIGTPDIKAQIIDTERLLAGAGLERVAGMSERVVRNVVINAAGRFDDILLERATGRLLMSDLKTKAGEWYSWMTVDAQLAGYAYAGYMLCDDHYVDGPRYMARMDLREGVVLHVPSDGGPAFLRRADLVTGWRVIQIARQIVDERAYGKSVARERESVWIPRTA